MSRHATVTGRLDADPDVVFGTLVDVRRLPDWNEAILGVLAEPDALVVGAEWVVEMSALGQRWPSRSRVEALDPVRRRFVHRSQTDDGNPSYAIWSWEVAEAQGGSEVTVRVELHPQTFWRRVLLGRIRHHQLMKSEIPASLVALSTVVTGSARG